MPLGVAEAWKEAYEALLEAIDERKAFMAVTGAAMTLVDVLDAYEDALEEGNQERIAELAEAGAEAEDTLVDALNQVHTLMQDPLETATTGDGMEDAQG
ncbi:hypothetical protein [Rubellimicrobium roseum]|uniref:Uncharacterized protein n=1 Tax=Rubellimicrobium roseum TaxID=687525 RepID=A0A5C4NJ83_9RHOB|nr:hypothetical protein [Rubellimicrobium roseum]TNC74162.1 hypothetical protein FHG71_02925 [Rubellimicrobium roseum]